MSALFQLIKAVCKCKHCHILYLHNNNNNKLFLIVLINNNNRSFLPDCFGVSKSRRSDKPSNWGLILITCYLLLVGGGGVSIVLCFIPRLFVQITIYTVCYFASWGVDALARRYISNTDKHLPRPTQLGWFTMVESRRNLSNYLNAVTN